MSRKTLILLVLVAFVVGVVGPRQQRLYRRHRVRMAVLDLATLGAASGVANLSALFFRDDGAFRVRTERQLEGRWQRRYTRALHHRKALDLQPSSRHFQRALDVSNEFPATDPRHRATLWQASEVARELARYDEAERHMDSYIAVVMGTDGETVDLARALTTKASIRLQQAVHDDKRFGSLLDQAEAILRGTTGPLHPERAALYHNRAMVHHYRRQFEQAERNYLLAMTVRQQALGEEHVETAETYGDLGLLYGERGDLTRGVPLCEQAIQIYADKLGADHPWAAWYREQLGVVYLRRGKLAEAAPLLKAAAEARSRSLGKDHQLTRRAQKLADLVERLRNRRVAAAPTKR